MKMQIVWTTWGRSLVLAKADLLEMEQFVPVE